MKLGSLSIVLHAHLPFVRHSDYPEYLEEDWLFEAITETYVPLIMAFDELADSGTFFRITMSLTPPLCEMLADRLLQERYTAYLHRLRELTEKEVRRTSGMPEQDVALMYREHFSRVLHTYENKYGKKLLDAFKKFQEMGSLEIIGSSATHALLPFVENEECRKAQIRAGCENYRKHFGRNPNGFWLPECAYTYNIDSHLRHEGVRWFILDTHGVLHANPRPKYGIFSPIITPDGVVVFGRDRETSKQVWSAIEGYPGDPMYREFYRDLGYDAEYEYIHPYLHSDGIRRGVGIKYHRITGRVALGDKQLYNPAAARERVASHASNFLFNRQHQLRYWNSLLEKQAHIVAPYDAELFGHWWFEGPDFLKYVFKKMHYDHDEIAPVTPSEYITNNQHMQLCQPNPSSWGDGGYFEVWANSSNDWIYQHLHMAERRMIDLARSNRHADGIFERALNQAARELFLAQSSDWAFIMTTGTHVPYAHKRFKDHIHRFNALYEQLTSGRIDEGHLVWTESLDNLFPELDFRVFI